jgi:hypothetical protein
VAVRDVVVGVQRRERHEPLHAAVETARHGQALFFLLRQQRG